MGIGILRGFGVFLEIPKVHKVDFHKYQECTRIEKSKSLIFHEYQRSTRTSILGQMIGDSSNFFFGSIGFAYDFGFCQNNGSLKISRNVFWKKSLNHAKRYQFVSGGFRK